MSTIEEQKEHLKVTLNELNNLGDQEKIQEFASLVYGKIAIQKIIDTIKESFNGPDDIAKAAEENVFVKKILLAVTAYAQIGVEMGYAEPKDKEDVSK